MIEHADETLVLNRSYKQEDSELDVSKAEARYARDLSDVVAMEHADDILSLNRARRGRDKELDTTKAEAIYAHGLSDAGATEHTDEVLLEDKDEGEVDDDHVILRSHYLLLSYRNYYLYSSSVMNALVCSTDPRF